MGPAQNVIEQRHTHKCGHGFIETILKELLPFIDIR